ncbi:MAG: hypothetical protein JWM78_3184 [Verrucomicrobiaceae bacterium]|nr:hypothetical protein [Verrucomicrobiaceae bacterium]
MYEAATKKIAVAIAISLGIALAGCGDRGKSADKNQAQAGQYYERAQNYLQQGQYRAAIIETRNALKLAPNDPRNSELLAREFNAIGQPRLAVQTLEPLAQNANGDIATELVDAYVAQKKYQTALDYLDAKKAQLPLNEHPELSLLHARALSGSGQFDAAKLELVELQKDPKIATRATLELARNLSAQGDNAAALALAQDVLQRDPKDIATLLFAARLFEQNSDFAHAEDLLSKALIELPQTDILTPTKIAVLETLSSVLTKLGRSSESLIYTKTLADADPERMRTQEKFNKGLELFQNGKLAEAEPLLNEVYQQSKNDTAGILLGMIKYANNDVAGAAQYLTAHVDPEVAPEGALLALAAADLRSAQPAKLLETFGPEQRARLKSPQLKALVGIALLDTGKTDEGARLVAQAQAEEPNNVAITTTLVRHYLTTGQATHALELLQGALVTHPQDASLNRLLISTQLGLGNNAQALEVARKFAAQQPPKADNLAVLGHTALLSRQLDVASDALQKALALDPKLISAQFDFAQLNLLQKHPEIAETQFKSILQTDADNVAAIKGLITAREIANGREATLSTVEQLVPSAQASPVTHAVIAEYYIRNARLDDADRLLKAIPDTADQRYANYVRQLLAMTRSEQASNNRDFGAARKELVQALRANPRSAPLLTQLARVELRANSPQEAEKVVAQLEQLQAQTPMVEELKADIAAAEQRWPDAVARYRTLWQRTPNDSIAVKLQRALSASDRAAAQQFLAEWQTKIPTSATPLLLQGMIAEQQGDSAAAIRAYETGVARDGNNAAVLNNLALLYLQKADKRALDLGAKAYQLQPRNAAVLDTYGWILLKNNQVEKARELLKAALQLAPDSKEIKEHVQQAERS